jgi:peroxiredoxin
MGSQWRVYANVLGALTLVVAGAVAESEVPSNKIRSGHNLLQDRAARPAVEVGETIGDFGFRDLDGRTHHLAHMVQRGPCAVVFLSTKCPLAKRYTERIKRVQQQFASQGASLIGVYSNADETLEGVRSFAAMAAFTFPIVLDADGYLARRFGATMTPQAFVLNTGGRLAYRGAIDDNRYETRVKASYLTAALEALLGGRAVEPSATRALGCAVHLRQPSETEAVTYSGQVARILQDNCQVCHRENQVGPFSLTTFAEARQWREEIRAYTQQRLMPPWKAAPGFGDFANDVSLSDAEIALIGRWVEQGAPEGNRDEAPPNPEFQDEWALGPPDLIVEMPEPYVVRPEGEDDYRHFVIPNEYGEDRYVEAIDVRPGNRNTVHHVLMYVDTSGRARELDAQDEGPGYSRFGGLGFEPVASLGGWAPGNRPTKTPPNTGAWLPPKSDIVMQVHYYRTGVEERDLTRVGLYFAKSPCPVRAKGGMVINTDFELRPGDAECEVVGERTIEEASYLYSVTPHMHLLGRTMGVTAHLPDGSELPLIRIDDWDFNWQTTYHFRELILLPAGTRLQMRATFDNSASNPRNPHDPPEPVRWGEKTTDEMCICFFGFISAADYTPPPPTPGHAL